MIMDPITRYAILFGTTAAAFYGFCAYNANQSKEDYKKTLLKRDTTRQEYESFGMDWGYKADDIIMQQIDSGDLLLINMKCIKAFTAIEVLECYKDTILQYRPIKNDAVAVAFRNKDGLKLLTNTYNKTQVMDYPSLLAHPGLTYLAIRKVEDFSVQDHHRLGEIVAEKQITPLKEKSRDMLNHLFKELGCLQNPIVNADNEEQIMQSISKKFGSSINVRTEHSKPMRTP